MNAHGNSQPKPSDVATNKAKILGCHGYLHQGNPNLVAAGIHIIGLPWAK